MAPRGSQPVHLVPDSPLRGARLVRRHQRAVWRYLRFLGADRSLADDLTQEAFLALLRSPPLSTDDRRIGAWLRRTAWRLLCNTRRRRREETLEFAEAEAAWESFVREGDEDGGEAMEALARCLDTLSERMQRALRLRYDSGGSRQKVSSALGLTANGAKTLLRRARQRVHDCVKERLSR